MVDGGWWAAETLLLGAGSALPFFNAVRVSISGTLCGRLHNSKSWYKRGGRNSQPRVQPGCLSRRRIATSTLTAPTLEDVRKYTLSRLRGTTTTLAACRVVPAVLPSPIFPPAVRAQARPGGWGRGHTHTGPFSPTCAMASGVLLSSSILRYRSVTFFSLSILRSHWPSSVRCRAISLSYPGAGGGGQKQGV